MDDEGTRRKPIWASWRVREDGSVHVSATYARQRRYVQEGMEFDSLEAAEDALGVGFSDVVARARAQGSSSGRWRP